MFINIMVYLELSFIIQHVSTTQANISSLANVKHRVFMATSYLSLYSVSWHLYNVLTFTDCALSGSVHIVRQVIEYIQI